MIAACVLFLFGPPVTAPTPTPPPVGRSTPVPAGGSLQDIAKRRRGFAPEEAMKGTFSVASEGSSGPVRHEGLTARTVTEGLLVEGKLVNTSDYREWLALEIFATRRDGRITRAIYALPPTSLSGGSLDSKSSRPFSRVLVAPPDPKDPASLRPETAGARIHRRPGDEPGSWQSYEYSLAGQDYLERIKCLSYWGKRVDSPRAKENEDDQVEVHVVNTCAWPVRARDTWFAIRIQNEWGTEPWQNRVYGLFVEDVPPDGELKEIISVPIPQNRRMRVRPYRLQDNTIDD